MSGAKEGAADVPAPSIDEVLERALDQFEAEDPVRINLPDGGRLHVDRPLPFLCTYEMPGHEAEAALEIAVSNASYLIAPDLDRMAPLIDAIALSLARQFGGFFVVRVGELPDDDLLADDSPYLVPFEMSVRTTGHAAAQAAADAFVAAVEEAEVKYRSPRISLVKAGSSSAVCLADLDESIAGMSLCFAPIYKQPGGEDEYPELRHRVIVNVYDCLLRAIHAFVKKTTAFEAVSHRALGRQVFVDAVRRVDARIDQICASFDFLQAVTPINSNDAWEEFRKSGNSVTPRMLYRPLTLRPDDQKQELHSISLDRLEDPVLVDLYSEKRLELNLQLTMLASRETATFRELGRALYGSVEAELLDEAKALLDGDVELDAPSVASDNDESPVDCEALKCAATDMIAGYRDQYDGFQAEVEIRDDLPAGLMVSGDRLMISRSTSVARKRVMALLSHEVGVHLLTYVNGGAHGLKLFRTGLSGYEGLQEGLAVFAEYLSGGMTDGRLRLLAARVIACDAMLDGAEFPEAFRLLTDRYDLSEKSAFNVVLRIYRSGGFAKDAIYLRGIRSVLNYLAGGGSLDPLWMGKIAADHLPVISELESRGLLKPPPVRPAFLDSEDAESRLSAARAGLPIHKLVTA